MCDRVSENSNVIQIHEMCGGKRKYIGQRTHFIQLPHPLVSLDENRIAKQLENNYLSSLPSFFVYIFLDSMTEKKMSSRTLRVFKAF